MTLAEATLPLSLGVVSSLHCAQMCGPLVLSYSVSARRGLAPHLYYNAGRLFTYGILGALAGGLGHAISAISGIEKTVMLVAGTLMVIAGILTAGIVPTQRLVQLGGDSFSRLFSRKIAPLLTSPNPRTKLALGVLLGLLPCGLVYAALIQAMGTGTALEGALSMVLFGVGTATSLLPIGLFSSFFAVRLGRWSTRVAALAMVVMGCLLLWKGVHAVTFGHSCHHL